jgi:hypothetical protein
VDEDFEMITVEVKGWNPKFTWEIVGPYRAPNEDMRAILIQKLAARTYYLGNSTKRSIIGDVLSFPCADWDSSVGIATGYGLDDQGEREFESR